MTKKMEVVRGLDLNKYMGRWYEIASLPSYRYFEPRNGIDTTATYRLNDDGTIDMMKQTWSKGKRVSIRGIAHKADYKSDEAKFKHMFCLPPFFPILPVVANYWLLYIDQNYQHAIIGDPNRKYLWIMSRQRCMEEERYKEMVEKGREKGYDVSKLRKTSHSDTPPAAGNPPKDKGFWFIKSLLGM